MSSVLGPIHFWLYDKIEKQEELTKEIAAYAKENGWIVDQTEYVRDLPPLESAIDKSNIHGWLQEMIHDSETRYAKLVCTIVNEERMDEMYQAAVAFGRKYAILSGVSVKEAYQAFEDFFLSGMPCDRVNQVVLETEDILTWRMTKDMHKQYWKENAELYYIVRDAIMCGMLELTDLLLVKEDITTYTIKRK